MAAAQRRRRSTPEGKLENILRSGLLHFLDGNAKPTHTMELLGCSLEEALERLVVYGYPDTELDHIRPLVSFDAANPEDIKKAWRIDNLSGWRSELMVAGCWLAGNPAILAW